MNRWFYVIAGVFLTSAIGDLVQNLFGNSARLNFDYILGAISLFGILILVLIRKKSK
jgi:hypothetical protein